MLTDYQRQLFSKLVDLNWEATQNHSHLVKAAIIGEYWRVREELMDDMGGDEYHKYVDGMRKMFAPAS